MASQFKEAVYTSNIKTYKKKRGKENERTRNYSYMEKR